MMRAHMTRRVVRSALVLGLVAVLFGAGYTAPQASRAAGSSQPMLVSAASVSDTPTATPTETGTAIEPVATSTATAPEPTDTDTATALESATVTPTPAAYQPGDPITINWPYVGQVWESAYWDQPDSAMFNELPGPGNRCSNAVSGSDGPLTASCFIPTDATPGLHTITIAEFSDYSGQTIADQYLTVMVAGVPPTTATSTATAVESASATPTGTATVATSATATPTPAAYQPGDPITISWPYVGQVWESAYWDQPDGAMFDELPGPGNRCSNAVNGIAGPLTASCFIPSNATPGIHTITIAEFSDYSGQTIADQYLTVVVAGTPASPTVSTTAPAATDTGTATASESATATPTPATYQPGDAITIDWPYVGQVWESAYWDQPSGGLFNELPGPGNRCSNAVSGSSGPLTASCFIPTDATPGLHTITIAEFSDYFGQTIADQYLTVMVGGVPPASPTAPAEAPAIAVSSTLTLPNTTTALRAGANAAAPLSITPSPAPVRVRASPFQKLIVSGVNFGAGEAVGLFWDNLHARPLATAPASRSGSFSATMMAPQAISGTHTIIALGLQTHKYAVTSITIQPEVAVAPSSGSAGSKAVTVGFGFGAREPVKLYWDKPLTLLGSTTSSTAGGFYGLTAVTGTVPLSATAGLHYIYAVGQTSHAVGVEAFTVH